jgi:hypothetical protein
MQFDSMFINFKKRQKSSLALEISDFPLLEKEIDSDQIGHNEKYLWESGNVLFLDLSTNYMNTSTFFENQVLFAYYI